MILQILVPQTVTQVLQMTVLTGMVPWMTPWVATPATLVVPHPILIQMMTMVQLILTIMNQTYKLIWLMPFWL
jgi:hypothetical protein